MKQLIISLLGIFTLQLVNAQVPCVNGKAGEYDCNQIDFMSRVTLATLGASSANDSWGWTDPETGAEIAIIGLNNATAFVDVTDPVNPIFIGKMPQPSEANNGSSWRDVKVYKDHAFVVSDANGAHGMQVFDLTRLRDVQNMPATFTHDARYSGVNSAHNVVINEATGFAYIVGARNIPTCGAGGLHIVDINEPKSPVFAGCFDADGYTHDAQCVIYNGPDSQYQGSEICFNANENTITIADVSNKSATSLLSRLGYPQVSYSHQGWLTEDHQYFLLNDELDEQRHGINTRTLIWDVRNLENPVLIGEYYSDMKAIDHNLYNHNGLNYQANYNSGLRITNLENVETGQLREMAFFDTHTGSNSAVFNGAWSNYPYFESGNVIVSDIQKGLFVLRPSVENLVLEHPQDIVVCDMTDGAILTVEATEDDLNYQWQRTTPNGLVNLSNNDIYQGVNSATLSITTEDETVFEEKYRCKISRADGTYNYTFYPKITIGFPLADFSFQKELDDIAFVNNSTRASRYEWDFGDQSPISEEENPQHLYELPGTYLVRLTAFNECGEHVSEQEIEILEGGILHAGNALTSYFKVYPNPSNGKIFIDSHYFYPIAELKIIDLRGVTMTGIEAGQNFVDISSLSTGLYVLQIRTAKDELVNFRIIKK